MYLLARKGGSVGYAGWELRLGWLSPGSGLLFPAVGVSSHVWEPGVMLRGSCCCGRAMSAAFAAPVRPQRLRAQLRVTVPARPHVASAQGTSPSEGTGRRTRGLAAAIPALSREALSDRLVPARGGRSFPGTTKPALVCDQVAGITKPGCPTGLPSRCIAVRTPRRITSLCQPPPALSFPSVGFAVLTALLGGRQRSRAGEEDPGPLNRLACGSHGSGPAVPFSSCPHSQELFAELRAPVQNCFSKEPLSA